MGASHILHSRRYLPARVTGSTGRHFGPDDDAKPGEFERGDFILTHGNTLLARFIRFGQSLAFWGRNRRYIWWSHAALIVSPDGDLIEAVGNGVQRGHISSYAPTDYHLVRLNALADERDREQICRYAEWCLGQEYGLLTNISIVISVLTGCRLTFGFDGQSICSGLVARALERGSVIFDRSPSHILPADLARYFEVPRPPRGSPRGRIPRPRPRAERMEPVRG